MPKERLNEFVLHEWVALLTFQQQALLLTGMRGPDGCSKHNEAKYIVRYLRAAIIKPAGNWSGANDNDFMWGEWRHFPDYAEGFFKDVDMYPHHFLMHLIHCAEVVGYKHDNLNISIHWREFYFRACKALHMTPETCEEMDRRLNDFGCGYKGL